MALLPDPGSLHVEEQDARALIIAVAVFVVAYAVMILLRRQVVARLRAKAVLASDPLFKARVDNMLSQVSGPELPLIAFYLATRHLQWTPLAHRVLGIAVVVLVGYRLIRIAQDAAAILIRQALAGSQPGAQGQSAAQSLSVVADFVIWFVGGLLILSNVGVNISSLLAGLGIGGVAAALAGQSILADFFAAVVIVLDKPFVAGDLVMLDNDWKGVVERTGFKTTRLRAPSGELVVVPNSALTNNKLRNLGPRASK